MSNSQKHQLSEPDNEMRRSKRIKEKGYNVLNENMAKKVISTTKITDVNTDCLELIFNHLEFCDLLNVANANKQFTSAAGYAFSKNYRMFTIIDITLSSQKYSISNFLVLMDRTYALKMLRCFGRWIPKLMISYMHINKPYAIELHRYLFKYCSETLNEIHFTEIKKCSLISFQYSFPKVQKVTFEMGKLKTNRFQLNEWFPKLCHLTLRFMREIVDPKLFEVNCPHLESLFIIGDCCDEQDGFKESIVLNILRLNPNFTYKPKGL